MTNPRFYNKDEMDAYFVRRRRLKWLKRGLSLVAILAAIFVILHGV